MAARLLPLQLSLSLYCLHILTTLCTFSSLKTCLFYRHPWQLFLLCCQYWWQPTSAHSTMVAAKSQWLVLSICCTLMATNPTITPFAIHLGQLSACFFSTCLHLAALPSLPFRERLWPSLQVLATPFNLQSHQSTPFLTQKDHYN